MNSDEKTKYDRPSFSFDSDRDIPNLIFMFGVIAVIAQVYIGWDDFSNVWSYMGINSQQALFEWQDATGREIDSSHYYAVKETAPLFIGWQIEIGFQVAVLAFIRHYSNAIKRLKAQKAI